MSAAAAVAVGSASAVRLPAWRNLVREHFVTLDIDADRASPFRGAVRTSMLGHLRVAEVSSVTQRVRRTDELLRADGARYLQLALVTRGQAHLRQDGRNCTLRPADFALYETDRPFFWGLRSDREPAWGLLVLTWPRATVALAEDESRMLTARRIDGHAGLGGVLSRTLRDLAAVRPDAGPSGNRLDGIAELVTAAAAALPGVGAPPGAGEPELGGRIEETSIAPAWPGRVTQRRRGGVLQPPRADARRGTRRARASPRARGGRLCGMKLSAGLLLYQVDGGVLRVLLAHMGGPFWARKDDRAWTVPKGEYAEGEEPAAAAAREFAEEMGRPAPAGGPLTDLGQIKLPGGKRLTVYALEAEFDADDITSNLFELEWPPRSGRIQSFPEVDRAAWYDCRTARAKLTVGQVPFLDALHAELVRQGRLVEPPPEALSPFE